VINEGLVAAALLWNESVGRKKVWIVDNLQHAAAGAASVDIFRGRARAGGRVRTAALVL
jgi:hypothetical protein